MKKELPPIELPKVNVWNRMLHVWTNPSFIKTVLYCEQEKAVSHTWVFWFVWNSLFAVAGTVAVWFLFAQPGITWLEKDWWSTVPAFEGQVIDGVFSTTLPEPYIVYQDEEFLAVIDTQQVEYTEAILANYAVGVLITADKMIVREDTGEYRSFNFSEAEEDFKFTKADFESGYYSAKSMLVAFGVGIAFVSIWFWLCLLRLISSAWWALIFWGVGRMLKVPHWTYGKSYLSVLNFYVVPLVFETLLLVLAIGILPFSTLLVLALVFGLNFYSFKPQASDLQ